MKFQELKRIADYSEAIEKIRDRNKRTTESIKAFIDGRQRALTRFVLDDFKRFFTELEFEVTVTDDTATAQYKIMDVQLHTSEPGRREEDMECLLKFTLSINAAVNEVFTVFLQNLPDDKGRSTAGSSDEKVAWVIDELRKQSGWVVRIQEQLQADSKG